MSARGETVAAVGAVTLVAMAFGVIAGAVAWDGLDDGARAAVRSAWGAPGALLTAAGVVVAAAVVWALWVPLRRYALPLRRLEESVRTMRHADPDHRMEPQQAAELAPLARAVGSLADERAALLRRGDERVAAASATLDDERRRLAALMAQLPQGVLVCNAEGRILLLNARAEEVLAGGDRTPPVGLGRSIYAWLDQQAVAHTLEQAQRGGGENPGIAHVVTAGTNGALMRCQVAPVRDDAAETSGFVMTVEDMTRSLAASDRRDELLRGLLERSRGAVATIRAASETVMAYPDIPTGERDRFIAIIAEEAQALSAHLEDTAARADEQLEASLQLAPMQGVDLLAALRARLTEDLGGPVEVVEPWSAVPLRVDSHALVQALAGVAHRVGAAAGSLRLRLTASGGLARLDLSWDAGAKAVSLQQHETAAVGPGGARLSEVVERHAGQVLAYADDERSGVRLLLPLVDPPGSPPTVRVRERPEFYDFALFTEAGDDELAARRLRDLTYTVFDTETTGLAPDGGDEVISLAGVRIVGGRVVRHERFNELVDPQRPVPEHSVAVHGITGESLVGRPTLVETLPAFARFCDDTVLVGHNVAFDLRFLHLKQDLAGVRFDQPALDTLLLSAVVHPSRDDHTLEAIAARLGVEVVGRHTALGDAQLTAEVFLRLVGLLEGQGVRTLGEARDAAARTYRARSRA